MTGKQKAESNVEYLTDAEIYAAICYLEPQVRAQNGEVAASLFSAAIFVLVVAWLGFIWLYGW